MGGDDAETPHRPSSSDDHCRERFPVGSIVEVGTDEKFSRVIYVPATVVPPSSSPGEESEELLHVEYDTLLADEQGSVRLREYVDLSFVRPTPPSLQQAKGFQPDDVVDALYEDVWWTGVVSRVVEGGDRVVVAFENPPEELEFGVSDVRAHWDWIDGIWVKKESERSTLLKEGNGSVQTQVNSGDNEVDAVANEPQRLQPCVLKKTSVESLVDVKTTIITSLHEAIGSMQVFKSIPQKPHFQPLEGLKESLREGLALGYMVAFASLVERCSRLQFNDAKEIIDEMMETLAELEGHGFDVGIVQDKLAKLLALKIKQEKLVVEMNIYKDHITEHNHEKTRIEDEILGSNEQMRRLQEKLSIAESMKEKVDNEIASLQARLKEAEEGVKSVECAFDCMVSSVL